MANLVTRFTLAGPVPVEVAQASGALGGSSGNGQGGSEGALLIANALSELSMTPTVQAAARTHIGAASDDTTDLVAHYIIAKS